MFSKTHGKKKRYFPGFNDEEIPLQPPKEKLNWCSRRFCFRRVSPQETSPKENLERFNNLCEKHKQQLHLAASKVINDWHTPDKPTRLTPVRGRKAKPAPQITARTTRPAPEPKSYRERVDKASHVRALRRYEREAQEAFERAPKKRNCYAAQKPKNPRIDRYASVYRQCVDVFNTY